MDLENVLIGLELTRVRHKKNLSAKEWTKDLDNASWKLCERVRLLGEELLNVGTCEVVDDY